MTIRDNAEQFRMNWDDLGQFGMIQDYSRGFERFEKIQDYQDIWDHSGPFAIRDDSELFRTIQDDSGQFKTIRDNT